MSRRSRKTSRLRAERGFTMVELMMTLIVLGTLAALAVPSFMNLIRGNRLTSSANEMVAMLQTARLAAVSNRASVSVCPTTNGTDCTTALGSRWIAVMTKDGATTVLRDSTLHPSVEVKTSPSLSGAGGTNKNKFTFLPSGFSKAGTSDGGTLALCVPELRGNNNDLDVSTSVGRINTCRRPATKACTAPTNTPANNCANN
ncbi:GspH/FimT family pseudopilin [Pseudoluteimonas lycopersici]